ncbi:MAG: ribulose-phosphate 3-epimerase [Bacteriovoracaceae bacterium]|jgi:ribulose-phosphate 3-epimerase
MTIIAPSILSADFLNLETEIKRFDGVKELWLHLDIMDGHFVPNLTFGNTILKNIKNITNHKLDAHLMVTNPQDYIEAYKSIGIHNFTFHWEAVTHHDRLISEIKKNFPSVGVALNPSTPIEVIPQYLLKEIDLILIMTVNPGFGGQSFIDGCINKVERLAELKKKNNYTYQIQVDGGVKGSNARELINAGASNLVAGSYIFSEPNLDYKSRIETLR